MEKRVNEKTSVVLVKREASTVEAIRAALVDKDAGKAAALPPPEPPGTEEYDDAEVGFDEDAAEGEAETPP